MPTDSAAALLRSVADTSLWSAAYRALESSQEEPLFVDPFAQALAGERGQRLVDLVAKANPYSWMVPLRTYLIDGLIERAVLAGTRCILNLAAGLDARPYRMRLPHDLEWIEVDSAEVLTYKRTVLGVTEPSCVLRHVALDLANAAARDDLLAEVAGHSDSVLAISEGLLIYLREEEVGALAAALRRHAAIRYWILDQQSRTLQLALQRGLDTVMGEPGRWLNFAPRDGVDFFRAFGWRPLRSLSVTHAARAAGRLPSTWCIGDEASAGMPGSRHMNTLVHVLGSPADQNLDSSIFSPARSDPTFP